MAESAKTELQQLVKATGGWFSGWKGKAGIKAADRNGNGFVDECEIENLIQFAHKELVKWKKEVCNYILVDIFFQVTPCLEVQVSRSSMSYNPPANKHNE
ncbi:unnamed protein product [Lactuca virosa]|uniref:EF-hand domain-containing protein n=1 Tax=Lactuca virosa TaxID=75947 RepID=A0AAU9M5T5_9ASTR|nr:unnamed protein product [Lactuca virosa]